MNFTGIHICNGECRRHWEERHLPLPFVDGPGGSKAFLSLVMLRAKRSEISDTLTPFLIHFLVFPGRKADFRELLFLGVCLVKLILGMHRTFQGVFADYFCSEVGQVDT